jgi:hypothetical protein
MVESTKFVGMDVNKEAITIAVMNSAGKVVMESIIETKAVTVLQFIQGLRGDLHVTFEEGTWAAWLYDLLKPHVTKVVVCNPRKSALLKDGSKGDKIDARKLAELLRGGYLKPVYHGDNGLRTYRSWAIPCAGTQVYAPRHRSEWLGKITEAGGRNFTTNNSTRCGFCTNKPGKSCWPRVGSTAQRSCYARFLGLVRSGRLTWLR